MTELIGYFDDRLDITPAEAEYIAQNVKAAVEYLRNMSPVWRDIKEGKKQHAV